MTPTNADYASSAYTALPPLEKTRRCLAGIAGMLGAHTACLSGDGGREGADGHVLYETDTRVALTPAAEVHLAALIDAYPYPESGLQPVRLPADQLAGLPFSAGAIIPLSSTTRTLGVVAVFWTDKPPTSALEAVLYPDADPLATGLEVLRLHLENTALKMALTRNVSSAQSILIFAEAVGDNPSPQRVVDILVENLLDVSYVSACALLMFNSGDDLPTSSAVSQLPAGGPPEYLEVRGTWTRRLGSGVAMGMRLYMKDTPRLLEALNASRVLTFNDVDGLTAQADPLIAAWLTRENIRSGTLIALQLGRQPLGVIAIGTEQRRTFTPRELHDYRTIAEFLSISVFAQTLQQQRDSVQQGRAALLESVTDGVMMVMPQADTGGFVLTANLPFQRMFDLDDRQVRGLNIAEMIARLPIDEETRALLRGTWLNVNVQDTATQRGTFSFIDGQGRGVDVQWYSAPVYQEDHVIGRIYTFNDVSAERAAERLRATFLSRVSHELRTPLTAIHGFAEFMLQNGDALPPFAREYTQIILNSAKQLKFLVNDLIEIGRANAGALTLNKTPRQMPDLIRDVTARLEMEWRTRRQTVTFDFPDDLPLVAIDYERMIQVFINLIANAIKYSPEGGSILVQIRPASTPAQLAAHDAPPDVTLPALVVTVDDSGAGLTNEEIGQVFLPFYRTQGAKGKKVEGVGLGLSIAQSLIEAHRGRLWAVPVPRASGGCFKITIPLARDGS